MLKELPHNINAEKSLIWCLIIDNDIINLVDLKKDDFYDLNYWEIFDLIKKLKSNWKNVDIVVLKEYLGNNNKIWFPELAELIENVPFSWNWKNYRDIIKEKSDRRKIINYSRKMESLWFKEDEEIQNILSWIENISSSIFNLKDEEDNWYIFNAMVEFEEIKETMEKNDWYLWLVWPYPKVDKYTSWFIKGKVYCLVAYSNVWKSQFSYNFVNDFIKKWKKVDYFSLEVKKWFLFKDILRNFYKKSDKEIIANNSKYPDEVYNLRIYDNIYKLEEIKTLIKANRPDFAFIDFIQNIQTPWSDYERMTKIAIDLQLLAIETWTTLFTLSQVWNENRFSSNEKIMPKWSGSIFSNSDVLFSLHRDDDLLYFSIIKNKFWPINKRFLVNPNFEKNIFNLTEEVNMTENWEINY